MTTGTLSLQELNEKYPERRRKPKTYHVDFQGIEARVTSELKPLTAFERECMRVLAHDPLKALQLKIDLETITSKFPERQRRVLQLKMDGRTNKEIAIYLNMSTRSVIRKLQDMYEKLHILL
jgi:DNA-binding NarL/FixJ family response regulator